jgi:predicted ester cyclase
MTPSTCAERFIDAAFVRFDAIDAAHCVTADFVSHPWAALGAPAGPAGVHTMVPFFKTAFAGVSATVLDRLVDGDRIALRYVYAGRHVGDLFGLPATGRAFSIEGIAIVRIADGLVAEYWREEDMLGLQRQLGVASLLAAAEA